MSTKVLGEPKLENKIITTIAIFALVVAIGTMTININRNAFAQSAPAAPGETISCDPNGQNCWRIHGETMCKEGSDPPFCIHRSYP